MDPNGLQVAAAAYICIYCLQKRKERRQALPYLRLGDQSPVHQQRTSQRPVHQPRASQRPVHRPRASQRPVHRPRASQRPVHRPMTTQQLVQHSEASVQISAYSGRELQRDLTFQPVSGPYKNFPRMSSSDFEILVSMVGPKVKKMDTFMRKAIALEERVGLTLRFLATGDSYTSLQNVFKISKQAMSSIVPEVCNAIVESLRDNIRMPTTEEGWQKIVDGYRETWNFPHCLGALDGKHVVLQAPMNFGSEGKSAFNIVLFAVVDAKHKFIFVDASCKGKISDAGVFNNCILRKKLKEGGLNIPKPCKLEGRNKEVPHFFLGDESFALSPHVMKVYPGTHPQGSKQREFNNRTRTARRAVENVFAICSSVFRVFCKPILLEPEKATSIVLAAVHLHNFLLRNPQSSDIYAPYGTMDRKDGTGSIISGTWRNTGQDILTSLLPIQQIPRKPSTVAKEAREELADYFMNEGKVSRQNESV